MKKTLETLVFFGRGPVAEASLKFLTNYFRVEAVVTKPATEEQMAKMSKMISEHKKSLERQQEFLEETPTYIR